MRFRNCLGMIWSVSTLTRSSGATSPLCTRNAFMFVCPSSRLMMQRLLKLPFPDIGEVPCNRGCCCHHRADQVRAASTTLPAFEVAVAGGGAPLAGLQDIGIHSQAHRAARFAPLESCGAKNFVQSFPLRGVLHRL